MRSKIAKIRHKKIGHEAKALFVLAIFVTMILLLVNQGVVKNADKLSKNPVTAQITGEVAATSQSIAIIYIFILSLAILVPIELLMRR